MIIRWRFVIKDGFFFGGGLENWRRLGNFAGSTVKGIRSESGTVPAAVGPPVGRPMLFCEALSRTAASEAFIGH